MAETGSLNVKIVHQYGLTPDGRVWWCVYVDGKILSYMSERMVL